MKNFLVLLALTCLFTACYDNCCSDSYVTNLVEENNPIVMSDISNNRINTFAEDKHGHVWIGTFRGLNKSTGREYHQYFTADSENSLPDNQINLLFNDSRDRMWVGTVNGVSRYTDQDCFENIPIESQNNNVIQIFEDLSGNIFLCTHNDLCVYDPSQNLFKNALSLVRVPFVNSTCFIAPNNDLWVVTPTDMKKYDTVTMEMKDSLGLRNYPTYSFMTEDGKLWLSGQNDLEIFNTRSRSFEDVPAQLLKNRKFDSSDISAIYPYLTNSLIIKTQHHGLFLYNYIEDTVCHQSESTFPFEVPDYIINTIFTDSNNNIWIGSYDQGYTVRYSYKKRFNNDTFLSTAIQNMSVTSLSSDSKGNIWAVTLGKGIFVYNLENSELKTIDARDVFGFDGGGEKNISGIFVDSDDYVWLLADFGAAKCKWDGRRLRLIHNYFAFMPMSICQTPDDVIWIGTASEYLYYIEPESTQTKVMKPLSANYTFMSAILPLPDGKLLLAALNQGIKEVDQETRTVVDARMVRNTWETSIKKSQFIPTCLFLDSDGIVWIGTMANGLLRYDRSSGVVSNVPGTPCDDICSIQEDTQGNLWVSTQYGLAKYDRTTGRFSNWFEADGIGGNQFYDRASCTLPDGSLVFGGTHGLTLFNPIDVMVNMDIPFVFEQLKVNNSIVKPGDGSCIDVALPYKPEIRLEYYENNFSISFAALHYSEFDRVRYQYRLEGYDDYWIETSSNNREANYANVPSGRYEFKVRVINNDRTMILAEDSLNIRVDLSCWLSWWSILIYLVVFSIICYALLKLKEKVAMEKAAKLKAQQEKEQEKKVNEMNMNFFTNISHEFRTPLTMISGPVNQLVEDTRISSDNRRLLTMIQRNTRRMLRLVNQLLDFNKLENGQYKLRVKPIDVIAQMSYLADIYKVTADDKGVSLKTWGIEESLIVWADEDCLDKICFNLLSNAMKFTSSGGKVEFGIDVISRDEAANHFKLTSKDTDSRYLKIVVKDNGPGIPDDQKEKIFERYYQTGNQVRGAYNWGTGIGLFFARTLAELHHGYLKVSDRDEGQGAQFTLLVPVNEASYSQDEKIQQESLENAIYIQNSVKYQEIPDSIATESQKIALVVDDDVDVTRYMKELLSPFYKVITKHDADSAFVTMKEEAPDIVISDVMMPGKSGYDLCRQIRDNIQLSHIPVILLTAKINVDAQVEGLGSGADAYVTKPFEPKFLLAQIESLLKSREKLKERLSELTDVENLEENSLSPQDSAFMSELYQLMENELSNSELDVARMTEMLHISRTKFYYKVKGLTGENPSVFFKRYKLNRAAQLMKDRRYNISEIADMTGFSTLSHFSTSFKKQFGVSPSEYMK